MENAAAAVQRALFRFVFVYLILYIAASAAYSAEDFPGLGFVSAPYIKVWHALVPWVATRVFHVTGESATYFPTGSGDTTLNYVEVFCCLVLGAAAAVVWPLLDRGRTRYRALHGVLRVIVRYMLASTMLIYGFYKVIPLQFGSVSCVRLIEPFGEFSRMGVLWSFMAASPAYTVLSGAGEVAAGLLLFFRRTTTAGALLSAAVMFNVAALNYCYDVPVKLFSTHLLLMAILLLAPEARRLVKLFVSDEASQRMPRAAVAVKVLFIGYVLTTQAGGAWRNYASRDEDRPPLYGLYEVERFTRNGQTVSDGSRWKKVAVQYAGGLAIRTMDDAWLRYGTDYDASKNTVTVSAGGQKYVWQYARPDADHVLVTGSLTNETIEVSLRAVDTGGFPLMSGRLHWIQEYPINR